MNYSRHCIRKLTRPTNVFLLRTRHFTTVRTRIPSSPAGILENTSFLSVILFQQGRNFSNSKSLLKVLSKEQPKSSETSTSVSNDGNDDEDEEKKQNEVSEGIDGTDPDNEDQDIDENITLRLTPEELQELTAGDEELIKKVKFIQMEHELGRQDGARVPFKPIKLKKWKELLELTSRFQRKKYFAYLWDNQIQEVNDKRKKQEKREKVSAEFAQKKIPTLEEDPHRVFYGLGRNTIFMRLYDSTMNAFYHNRVISEMLYGQPLIFDCGYDEFMNRREAKNCAKQLEYFLTDNRVHPKLPMNIILCNIKRDGDFFQVLCERINNLEDDGYALNITEQSYLDMYPKEKLVYLTPHARDELQTFNDDDIYIVGMMVDKSDPRPFSLAKAKREGLRMKKLPLDSHFEWGLGNKSLTINQMGNIMLDFYNTRDWNIALKHVPTRKLRREDQVNPTDRYILEPKRRKERTSTVLADFELMRNRKTYGFKSARSGTSARPKLNDENERDGFRPNLKSILHDD